MNLPKGRVASSQKRILCLSSNKDKPEVFIMGYTAGKKNYIFDKSNFNVNNPLPGRTLEELIKKGLRRQVLKKIDTGYFSPIRRKKNKSGNSLIKNAIGINDKKHWLHYLSFTEKNIKKKYNAEQIVHCLDIHYKTFFA